MASSFSSPCPDPKSPVLSKIDFGVPLVELFKWLDVRDTFLAENERIQDIANALALARDCKHPDAEWLTSIFEGKDVSTEEEAREVFLSHQNDARALCFAWFLTYDPEDDFSLLRRSAEMGNAFACSTLFIAERLYEKNEEKAFRLAQFAASQHERDGLFLAGRCFYDGIGCEKDLNLAKENFLIAAELGHVNAAEWFGSLLGTSDPVCWSWFARAALRGISCSFRGSFSNQVERFFSGSGNATIVFLIGRALQGNIDIGKFFGHSAHNFNSVFGPANQAVSFYSSQIKSARLAVSTWTLLATRIHLIKDMRIFIGKMIWEARFEANYVFDLDDDGASSSPSQTLVSYASSSTSALSPSLKRSRR